MISASFEFNRGRIIRAMYDRLLAVYGPQSWWPARTAIEVMVGAVLVQNTNWANVERAIRSLNGRGLLNFQRLHVLPEHELAELIRPAGYFRVKARRLRNLLDFLAGECGGDIKRLARKPVEPLRKALLGVNGIGPETADSILLYALHKPVFVVDAYSRRLLKRHGFSEWDADYGDVQSLFMAHLPREEKIYNEYHALIVRLGKDYKNEKSVREGPYPLEDSFFFL